MYSNHIHQFPFFLKIDTNFFMMSSMEFLRQEYWSGLLCPPLGDLPNPGIKPRSPTLQADSLAAELPRKPKNPGVGSLSLLQGNFLMQELNQDFLHCRWILYHLSYRGSPKSTMLRCSVTSVMSDSVRPHRRQPTRLPRPWDSPGKNT